MKSIGFVSSTIQEREKNISDCENMSIFDLLFDVFLDSLFTLKGLSLEINFKNFDQNLKNLA
jgi:hypothetical protein